MSLPPDAARARLRRRRTRVSAKVDSRLSTFAPRGAAGRRVSRPGSGGADAGAGRVRPERHPRMIRALAAAADEAVVSFHPLDLHFRAVACGDRFTAAVTEEVCCPALRNRCNRASVASASSDSIKHVLHPPQGVCYVLSLMHRVAFAGAPLCVGRQRPRAAGAWRAVGRAAALPDGARARGWSRSTLPGRGGGRRPLPCPEPRGTSRAGPALPGASRRVPRRARRRARTGPSAAGGACLPARSCRGARAAGGGVGVGQRRRRPAWPRRCGGPRGARARGVAGSGGAGVLPAPRALPCVSCARGCCSGRDVSV